MPLKNKIYDFQWVKLIQDYTCYTKKKLMAELMRPRGKPFDIKKISKVQTMCMDLYDELISNPRKINVFKKLTLKIKEQKLKKLLLSQWRIFLRNTEVWNLLQSLYTEQSRKFNLLSLSHSIENLMLRCWELRYVRNKCAYDTSLNNKKVSSTYRLYNNSGQLYKYILYKYILYINPVNLVHIETLFNGVN